MPDPIDAVLFDFHQTLVDPGDTRSWLHTAWALRRRPGTPEQAWGDDAAASTVDFLDHVWAFAAVIDPESRRDVSTTAHRRVWDQLMARHGVDADLGSDLYATVTTGWRFYDDAVPILRELRRRGVRTAIVSNIAVDVRPVVARDAGLDLFDALVLSYEVGEVKPNPGIFARALDALGVPATRALMVGDSWRDDGGAAQIGVRTLILPRTSGREHGLRAVLDLVTAR